MKENYERTRDFILLQEGNTIDVDAKGDDFTFRNR